MREETPWWLLVSEIVGFEEDEDEETEDEEEEDEDSEDEEDEDSDEDQEEGEEDTSNQRNIEGLKKALRTERMERKKLARELKKLKTKPSEEESEPEENSQNNATLEKLAEKFRTNAIDTVILKYAADFQDNSVLLRLIDRSEIDVDQDEEDPSEIEVDEDSVKDAVKALAKKSPYLLKSEEERTRSGSKFAGSKKNKNRISDEALRNKYPGLRR